MPIAGASYRDSVARSLHYHGMHPVKENPYCGAHPAMYLVEQNTCAGADPIMHPVEQDAYTGEGPIKQNRYPGAH